MLTLLLFVGFVIMTGLWLSAKHDLRQERMFENEDINDAPVRLSVFAANEARPGEYLTNTHEVFNGPPTYFDFEEMGYKNPEATYDWLTGALPDKNEIRIIELEEELKRAYDNLEMVLNATDPLCPSNIERNYVS